MRQKSRLLTLLIITFLFVGQSCDDYHNPIYDYQTIWKCHYESSWDYGTTKDKIVGLWEWKYVKCCGEASKPYQNGTESKGIKIEFNPDGTGILTDNETTGEFTWDIELKDNDLYGFQAKPPIAQLHGRLLFCNDILMCNGSYIDGADNYFKKIVTGKN